MTLVEMRVISLKVSLWLMLASVEHLQPVNPMKKRPSDGKEDSSPRARSTQNQASVLANKGSACAPGSSDSGQESL